MIILREKDIIDLGIKSIEFNNFGQLLHVYGITGRIDKLYNWKVLGIEYCGG